MPEAHTPAAFVPVTPASLSGRGTDFPLSPAAHSCGHAINKLDALLGDLHDALDARARQRPRPRRRFGAGHGVDTKTRLVFSFASSTRYWTKLRSQCGATVRRKRKRDYPTNTAAPCPRRNGERRSPYLVRYRARIDRHDHIRHDSAHRIKRVHQRGVRNSLRHAGLRRSARRGAPAAPTRRLTRQASRRQRAIRESVSSWCFSPEIQHVNTHAVRDQTEARLPSEARAFFVNTRNSDTAVTLCRPAFLLSIEVLRCGASLRIARTHAGSRLLATHRRSFPTIRRRAPCTASPGSTASPIDP